MAPRKGAVSRVQRQGPSPRASKEPRKWVTVLTGSQLNGADENLASWAGLEIPTDREDDYVNLVGGVTSLGDFFDRVEHGIFEVTEEEEDMGPGMSDTYWTISAHDPDALRAEVRQRLVEELRLEASAAPGKPGTRLRTRKK